MRIIKNDLPSLMKEAKRQLEEEEKEKRSKEAEK